MLNSSEAGSCQSRFFRGIAHTNEIANAFTCRENVHFCGVMQPQKWSSDLRASMRIHKSGIPVVMVDGYDSSEPADGAGEKVPGWTPELGTRLKAVLKRVGGLKGASTIVGYKAEQIAKWRDGNARPPFYALQLLAKAADVSLDWIAGADTGRDPRPTPPGAISGQSQASVDEELMGRITDAISRLYKEEKVGLAAIDLGRLTGRKYAEITAATENADERLAMIKLVVTQLRADLRSAAEAPGNGKRLA